MMFLTPYGSIHQYLVCVFLWREVKMLIIGVSRSTPAVLLLADLVAPSQAHTRRPGNACRDAKIPHSIFRDSLRYCNDAFRLAVGYHVFSVSVYWYVLFSHRFYPSTVAHHE